MCRTELCDLRHPFWDQSQTRDQCKRKPAKRNTMLNSLTFQGKSHEPRYWHSQACQSALQEEDAALQSRSIGFCWSKQLPAKSVETSSFKIWRGQQTRHGFSKHYSRNTGKFWLSVASVNELLSTFMGVTLYVETPVIGVELLFSAV